MRSGEVMAIADFHSKSSLKAKIRLDPGCDPGSLAFSLINETRNYSLPRRQWIGTEQLFEELDDLTLPRQILDNFFKRVPS